MSYSARIADFEFLFPIPLQWRSSPVLKLHLLESVREVLCLNDLRQYGLGELKLNALAGLSAAEFVFNRQLVQ